ncbi:MAG: hypothetical protein ACRD00_04620, partial [Thermoanaerobaculia bacterium]
SPAEFALDVLPAAIATGWMAVVVFVLLKDHAAAWVLFGALAFGGAGVAALLGQPARPDQMAGWAGAALLAIAVIALVAGKRGAAPAGGGAIS